MSNIVPVTVFNCGDELLHTPTRSLPQHVFTHKLKVQQGTKHLGKVISEQTL